ncbi:hypothetical protein [Nocardia aurantia]|uniref:DUF2637 domain-containing protein n=1 Tax=Nocardia aurantia TaxID=2585199 RepID=A0A7K0DGU7_9NOCA|nr:hypothetical protein [Nocardia aurantia]MQY24908.1 hypothetical protein [Nocardia aurantia]
MREDQPTGKEEIAALAQQVKTARGKLPLQQNAALFDVLSDDEFAAERELAEWTREKRRRQRRDALKAELSAERRDRRVADSIRRSEEADDRWHRRALAARRRVSSPDARLAQLFRRAEWSSRALIGVVVIGMVWAGVNVQHNLVPSGDMTDPLYWLSYGFEAMISIPIITIMMVTTTAARWGRDVNRGRVVLLEAGLLGVTIALNAGPHIAAGRIAHAAEAAVAPIMVGVVIWLHAWVSARYAMLIEGITELTEQPATPPVAATTVRSDRIFPAEPDLFAELELEADRAAITENALPATASAAGRRKSRAAGSGRGPDTAADADTRVLAAVGDDFDDSIPEGEDVQWWTAARAISDRGMSTLPVEQLAEILTLADQSASPTSISTETGLSRAAVVRVLDSARKLGPHYAITG